MKNQTVYKFTLILVLLSVGLFCGCEEKNDEAKYDTIIPFPTYTYYAVAPGETVVTIDMMFFCPTSISDTDLQESISALGNTDSIQVTKSEIFQTFEIEDADFYYAELLFTLDVKSITTNTLQFNTISYTLPEGKTQYLHIGPLIIDNHFTAEEGAQFLSEEEENALTITPDIVYLGYPDNPNYYFQIYEMYPNIFYYTERGVYQYTIDGQTYYAFQNEESGWLQKNSPKSFLALCQSAYAEYKEANDELQALRDTNPDH